tara:strand:+ start:315 stop:2039 length:1725 start_codon:yes stop_codon:yes gene_type:complete
MKSLKKIFFIVGEENKIGLYILISFNLIHFFLEFFSLISIPIFVAALLGNEIPANKISSYLSFLSQDNFLLFSIIFVILTFLLKNFLLIYNAYFQAKYIKNIRSALSIKFFNHYFDSSVLNNYQIIPSVMARNVTIVVQGFYAYFENFNRLVKELAASITIAIILFILNFKVTLIIFLTFLIVSFFYLRLLRPKIKKKAKENQALVANFNKVIFETFEAIRDIKVYQKEKVVSELFKEKINTFENNFFFFNVFDKFPRIILELVSIFSILIASIVFFSYTNNVFETLPILALVIISAIRLIPAFTGISTALFYLRVYDPNINTICDQLNEINLTIQNNKKENNQFVTKQHTQGLDVNKNYLVVDQISFSYEKNKTLLKNITLNIPKGSFVSIMGRSGSGKTTLQNIIMGLIKPNKGNIFYQNQNIFSIYNKWMSKISYVSQKVFLFDDTVERNICLNFDDSKIDQEKLEKAVEVSEIKEKIEFLNNKIHENVGTDGLKLSGGERQRIALARAIYKGAEILFLDEFTSNLDILTEEKIISKLRKNFPETTVIIITHRPEIAKKSDMIFNLDKVNN